jgi:t-SNARE complex subunit (syntaxin)
VSQVGTSRDSSQLRTQINKLSDTASRKTREAKQRCQPHLKSSNSNIRMQYDRLLRSLMDQAKILTDEQEKYTRLQRQHATPTPTGPVEFGMADKERFQDESQGFGAGFQLEQEYSEDMQKEELARQRHEELRNLEGNMTDLHEMFLEMGTLVADQGDQLDVIETNIETAAISVERAKEETRQAVTLKEKIRRKKWTCTICCIVLLLIIGGIIAIVVLTN